VFQLNPRACATSAGASVDSIDVIIALIACSGPADEHARRLREPQTRQGAVAYDHPLLEPILKETYGVFVYQEQVMQAANVSPGYSLGGADILRRAMGKKKPRRWKKQRDTFLKGCHEKKQDSARPGRTDLRHLAKFAGYGFNKSHSAAYAIVAYQTAWLKANYPVQFLAALLSNELANTEKIQVFINECKHSASRSSRPTSTKAACGSPSSANRSSRPFTGGRERA